MKIDLCSVPVDDQERALRFYTENLGFEKKVDIPLGEFRWVTVVSADAPDGVQLVLEPNAQPATAAYQKELFEADIPWTSFATTNLDDEYEALKQRGVRFTMPPTSAGDTRVARFDDTCGNLIQLHES